MKTAKIATLPQFRNDDGNLVDVGIGCYIQIYVCKDGTTLCANCAEKQIQNDIDQQWESHDAVCDAFSSADTDSYILCEFCARVLSEGFEGETE